MKVLWFRRGLAVVIGVLLAVQGVVVGVHTHDEATPVSVDAAVDRFRTATPRVPPSTLPKPIHTTTPTSDAADSTGTVAEDTPRAPGPGAAAPAGPEPEGAPTEIAVASEPTGPSPRAHPTPGVYAYWTEGYERVDALGGRRHDYPRETTITYTADSCGVRVLWAPLEDRYDERLLCAGPGGTEMRWFESSHAFFGQRDTRLLVCDPSSILRPDPANPGEEWSFRCVDDRTEAVSRSRVVDVGPMSVGNQTRTAVHVEVRSTVTGDSRADSTLDVWLDEQTGLVLRQIFALDGTSPGPSGDVAYTERYELQLQSIEPRT